MRKSNITRDEAFELLKKYNKDPFHIRHALTVEGVMRWYAKELGYADEEEYWAIVGLLHELFQPCLLDIVLELDTQRAVVPAIGQTAVDLGTGEHITTVLAEIDDHIKGLFALFHCKYILSVRGWFAVSCCVFVPAAFPAAGRAFPVKSTVSLLYHVLRGL